MSTVRTITAYAQQLASLMPRGRVWPEAGGPIWDQLLSSLAVEFRRVDARALQLLDEADPRTCGETLEDWERVLGLPDSCAPGNQTFTERRNAVVALLLAEGGASVGYFISLASSRGYTITITEHRPFICARSSCGHQETPRPIGSPNVRLVWTVALQTNRLRYFQMGTGQSRCGVDTHLAITRADEIECLFERLKPAHTEIVFDYSQAA